ncbi:MAG TPA: hypothetical protein VHS31_04970 [Tepidisphaeraceae bacterium]|nr:hypothetical protein [Tepidisphaeraceae bacterium]
MKSIDPKDVDWDNASDPDDDYNCMGYAMAFNRWWSPPKAPNIAIDPRNFWPPFITDDSISIEAYIEAAETRGFKCCDDSVWENEFTRIVFCHDNGEFTHVALQISSDFWQSKFGNLSDFPHTLDKLDSIAFYGAGRQFMKKRNS